MKTTKALEIRFKSLKNLIGEVGASLKTRKPSIQPKNEIYFASLAGFRSFMSIQKIEILSVIANHTPKSIYELAKWVDRDFPAVLRDCISLESAGFIQLKEKKDSKGTKQPKLAFTYSRIIVNLPNSPYQIEIRDAA
jgi:predicted transcriptional regulator